MTFFSIKFFIFLSVVFIIYYLIPARYRYLWLLVSSCIFYASWSVKGMTVLGFITLVSYSSARMMEKANKRLCLVAGIVISLATLIAFKFLGSWTRGRYYFNVPVGLSFFVLEAVGYMIDVYSGKMKCEQNIGRYGLFLSFFPTVLSGPIERSSNLLKQIQEGREFSYEKAKRGLLLIIEGGYLKLLIANRLAMIVNAAFENHYEQTGATMLIAVIFYGIQLYADFAGYTCIALGVGHLFGFSLTENFRQPYFAGNIRSFWRRWHLSLSSWLRDYVYIPLGGNRKGKIRQYVNLLITFLISGIWHGTGWQFVVWGALHGIYQVVSNASNPWRMKVFAKIKRECFSYRLMQVITTFGLVDFAWLFFRAASVREALLIGRNILFNFQIGNTISSKLYLLGFDESRFLVLLIEIFALLVVDILHEKEISIVDLLERQNKAFRWIIYLSMCMVLVIGSLYDYGVEASTFIYTRF